MRTIRTVSIVAAVVFAAVFGADRAETAGKKLIYMAVWIGCEDVCRGLQDYIAEQGIDAEVVVRDADRDKSKLPGFVDEARALKADLVVTWGTSVTLGIAGTLKDQDDPRFLNDIPLVFTVVADPVRSNVIESYEKTGRSNITGTRNRVPESVNIKSIRRYMPNFRRLGILYNPAEENSVLKVEEVRGLTGELDFELEAVALGMGEDGQPAPASIGPKLAELKSRGAEFVYLGSSTFLEKNGELFTASAVEAGLPVLSPYEHLVQEAQALMSVAARDYDVGLLAGDQAAKILVEGRSPGELPVISIDQYAYTVNMRVAKQLDLLPSIDFLQFVEIVE